MENSELQVSILLDHFTLQSRGLVLIITGSSSFVVHFSEDIVITQIIMSPWFPPTAQGSTAKTRSEDLGVFFIIGAATSRCCLCSLKQRHVSDGVSRLSVGLTLLRKHGGAELKLKDNLIKVKVNRDAEWIHSGAFIWTPDTSPLLN